MRPSIATIAEKHTLTFVLSGGQGHRLYPLTRDRAKPAVPFGGIYRIIDFTLSNAIHSGLHRIELLTQYKSYSLDRHILRGWNHLNTELGEYIHLVPPQQRTGEEWYKGTADAIYQNIYSLERVKPDYVVILAGDHIYQMDYRKMIRTHVENNAELTVACVKAPVERAREFGVMSIDSENRIVAFEEKPEDPQTIPGEPGFCLVSMGIYVFSTEALVRNLVYDAKHDTAHDFGRDVIPDMIEKGGRVFAHSFVDLKTGASRYWSDIGTLDAYFQTTMDFLRPDPPFDLTRADWPMLTYHTQTAPAKLLSAGADGCRVANSSIGAGSVITDARVENSVLGYRTSVEPGAQVTSSILFDGVHVGKGTRLRNVIIDKHVTIPDDMTIGLYRDEDQERFTVTDSGIVVLPKQITIFKGKRGVRL